MGEWGAPPSIEVSELTEIVSDFNPNLYPNIGYHPPSLEGGLNGGNPPIYGDPSPISKGLLLRTILAK